ncbi:hypothetical protein, partial [Limisphaera ngatamarikiensis]|uniref:hypothetical protein n=1 Tax=Limisphaera ngatamarikiensis TaxID=1324935 RepID=UPI00197D0806
GTGLVLYEYRAYSPSLGRWLSRDLIEERAFQEYALRPHIAIIGSRLLVPRERVETVDHRAYIFVGNAPIRHNDYLGLEKVCSRWHCGRAIDRALRLTFEDVLRRYSNLSLWGKIKACAPIWAPVPGFDMAWDMETITWAWGNELHCGNEKTCEGTVTVAGGCYDAWDVNFMLYGWAARLCGMKATDLIAYVVGWKLAKPILADDGEGNDWERPGQWLGFAIAGYYFSFDPPAPPSSLSGCSACAKRTQYPKHLESVWPR